MCQPQSKELGFWDFQSWSGLWDCWDGELDNYLQTMVKLRNSIYDHYLPSWIDLRDIMYIMKEVTHQSDLIDTEVLTLSPEGF